MTGPSSTREVDGDLTGWRVQLRRWRGGWAWDLTAGGRVLPYRTGADGTGLWALRPADQLGRRWEWTCLDPAAWWPPGRSQMRQAIIRHYGL